MNARHSGLAKVWLLNAGGNAALLAAAYLWLTLPDAHVWQVAASALLAVALVFCGLWLRAGSLAYFRVEQFRDNARVWQAFRRGLRNIVALAVWVAPVAAIVWFLFSLRQYTPQFGVWWWQKAPALRLGSPRAIYHTADWVLWLVIFLCVALWLPVATTVAAYGLKPARMRRSLRVLCKPKYWLWVIALVVIGAYVPYRFVWWVPQVNSMAGQAWSAGVRFAIAYLVLVSAWVALLLEVGMRVEQEDQVEAPDL